MTNTDHDSASLLYYCAFLACAFYPTLVSILVATNLPLIYSHNLIKMLS